MLLFSVAFSQNNKAQANISITGNYNAWMETGKLGKFLTAELVKDSTTSAGEKIEILVLKPASAYKDPLNAAMAWTYLSNGFQDQGINIYMLLLTKFADYSGLPLNSVMVTIETEKPEIFSLKIYYGTKLEYDEKNLSVRGPDRNFDFDFKSAAIGVLQGSYHLQNSSNGLKTYCKNLLPFFKPAGDKATGIDIEIYTDEMIRLKVTYPLGHVTGKRYHEIIFLDINLVHLDNNQLKILYDGDVLYAGGIFSVPTDINKYEDASTSFYENVVEYNQKLDSEFKKLLYGDK
jgi:hypothetical protein